MRYGLHRGIEGCILFLPFFVVVVPPMSDERLPPVQVVRAGAPGLPAQLAPWRATHVKRRSGPELRRAAPEEVDGSWTHQLLERRLGALREELRTLCTRVDGRSSLEERIGRFVAQVETTYLCTPGHGQRVARVVLHLAQRWALPGAHVRLLFLASLLHDIGKAGVPEVVLFRPGKRRGANRRSFQAHPSLGADLLAAVPPLAGATPVVRHHHERYDGRGYPDGLSAEAIPLGARLLAVADAFDALTAGRLYRPPVSPPTALAEMARHAGTQFDPDAVSVLIAVCGDDGLTCARVRQWGGGTSKGAPL